MNPAAKVLKCCRNPPELFSQSYQQQQHVGEQRHRKLENGWKQPAEEEQQQEGCEQSCEKYIFLYD